MAATSTARLSIGGIGLSLRSDQISIELSKAVRQFSADVPDADCEIDVQVGDVGGGSGGDVVFDSHGVWILTRERDGVTFSCRSDVFGDEPYKIARFERGFRRGTIVLNERYFESGTVQDPLGYPLDELLVTNLLARKGGAEVHGCAVVVPDGRAMIFAGQSGAGKSTFARLVDAAGAASVITDERVIVRDEPGGLTVYGTPWHGEAGYAVARRAPLGGVFFLEQASLNAVVAIPPAAAAARLIACSFPPLYDHEAVAATLRLFGIVAERVPCRVLRFLPDQTAVQCVADHW